MCRKSGLQDIEAQASRWLSARASPQEGKNSAFGSCAALLLAPQYGCGATTRRGKRESEENKADSMIERAHTLHFFFELAREVGAEGLRSLLREPDTPAALIGLGRTQSNLAPGPRH